MTVKRKLPEYLSLVPDPTELHLPTDPLPRPADDIGSSIRQMLEASAHAETRAVMRSIPEFAGKELLALQMLYPKGTQVDFEVFSEVDEARYFLQFALQEKRRREECREKLETSSMKTCTSVADLRATLLAWEEEAGRPVKVGLVPTMGPLHKGHQYLLEQARRENERVIVSVFVDPWALAEFQSIHRAKKKDDYPRYPERDREIACVGGADLLFLPSKEEISPAFHCRVEEVIEDFGLCYPGMMQLGETMDTIFILCQLIEPHVLYLGSNDFHQKVLIHQMMEDYYFSCRIVEMPMFREQDGVLCLSENHRLPPQNRRKLAIFHGLFRKAVEAIFFPESLRVLKLHRAHDDAEIAGFCSFAFRLISGHIGAWKQKTKQELREIQALGVETLLEDILNEGLAMFGKKKPESWEGDTLAICKVALRTYPSLRIPNDLSVRSLVCWIGYKINSVPLVDTLWITEQGIDSGVISTDPYMKCGWIVDEKARNFFRNCIL